MTESVITWQHVIIALLNFLTVLVTWRMGAKSGRNAPRRQWSDGQRNDYRMHGDGPYA